MLSQPRQHPTSPSVSPSLLARRGGGGLRLPSAFALVATLLLLLLDACGQKEEVLPDARVVRARALAETDPPAARALLDSICPDSLSEPDRHLFDLVSIRTADKTGLEPKCDSLIEDVLSFTETHPTDSVIRAEALYNAARVYNHIHDYPLALNYFQRALDVCPVRDDTRRLQGLILSQTSHLLRKLGLIAESIPYTEQALEIRTLLNDTQGQIYATRSLGYAHSLLKQYDKSYAYYKRAYELSQQSTPQERAMAKLELADMVLKNGNVDSALFLVRNSMNEVKPTDRNVALGIASYIYSKAGISDSAYKYAFELVHSADNYNKQAGYYVLLSPEMLNLSPIDSLFEYVADYRRILSDDNANNSAELVINRHNYYDYSKHAQRRDAAEKEANRLAGEIDSLKWWFILSIVLNLGLLLYIFYKRRFGELREVKKEMIARLTPEAAEEASQRSDLRRDILTRVESLSDDNLSVPSDMNATPIVAQLRAMVTDNKVLTDNSELWSQLEAAVKSVAPHFIDNLNFLSESTITENERRTALLLRVGITSAEMGVLVALSKGAVGSRRASLSQRLFETKLSPKRLAAALSML